MIRACCACCAARAVQGGRGDCERRRGHCGACQGDHRGRRWVLQPCLHFTDSFASLLGMWAWVKEITGGAGGFAAAALRHFTLCMHSSGHGSFNITGNASGLGAAALPFGALHACDFLSMAWRGCGPRQCYMRRLRACKAGRKGPARLAGRGLPAWPCQH